VKVLAVVEVVQVVHVSVLTLHPLQEEDPMVATHAMTPEVVTTHVLPIQENDLIQVTEMKDVLQQVAERDDQDNL
jgi:hypothetical protein